MGDTKVRVAVSMCLDCGCEITHAGVSHGLPDLSDKEAVRKHIEFNARNVAYWFHWRLGVEKRHDCSLVNEENPNGIKPREAK